jgi:hypothetical protein
MFRRPSRQPKLADFDFSNYQVLDIRGAIGRSFEDMSSQIKRSMEGCEVDLGGVTSFTLGRAR